MIPQTVSSSYSALESGRLSEGSVLDSVSVSVTSPSSDSSDRESFAGLVEESLVATEGGDSSSISGVFCGDGVPGSSSESSKSITASRSSWLVDMLKTKPQQVILGQHLNVNI